MKGIKRRLLRLLLIAIMALQPAVSVYAMAEMTHNPERVPQAMAEHQMAHEAMHHDTDNTDKKHASASGSMEEEGCCGSGEACTMAACPMSACSAALITTPLSISETAITLATPTQQLFWAGISLPTEIRPPRRPLG